MNNNVSSPSHYVKNAIVIEPIELTGRLNSCLGQVLQYVIRREDKDTELENLQKALFWLKWYEDNITSQSLYTEEFNVSCDGVKVPEVQSLILFFIKYTKDAFLQDFMRSLFNGAFVSKQSVKNAIDMLGEEIKRIEGESK